MPSPPQTKTRSAPVARARVSTCFGRLAALRHLVPDRVVDAARSSTRRSSRQAAAERLAGVGDHRDVVIGGSCCALSAGGAICGTRGEQRDRAAAEAHQQAGRARRSGGACRGTCARARRSSGSSTASVQRRRSQRCAKRDVRAARARRRRRPTPPRGPRVALVHRQMVEPRHGRARAVHDQARDAIGRDLDQDRAEDEADDAPAAHTAATITTRVTRAGRTGCRRSTSRRSRHRCASRRDATRARC